MGRRLTILDLNPREVIKPKKVEGIMTNGEDNKYPTRMDRIIEGSVTAKASADMLSRFCVGDGFLNPELNNVIIGYDQFKRPILAYKLLRQLAKSLSRQNGFFIRAGFNPALETKSLKFYNFGDCRFSHVDDTYYAGRIAVYNNWDNSISKKYEKDKVLQLNVWNPDKTVIASQVKNDITTYKGQMYFNFIEDDYLYPLSPVDVVQFDADSEDQVSKFKNSALRKGFNLNHIIHHSRFETEDAQEDFMKDIEKFMGGDHSASVMVLEGEFDQQTGELIASHNIKVEKIEQALNDKLYDVYEKSWSNNIRKAFDAMPKVLIDYEVSQLGNTSGEAIRQAAEYYNQQTAYRRAFIEDSFKELFANWHDPKYRGISWEIKPLEFLKNGATLVTK